MTATELLTITRKKMPGILTGLIVLAVLYVVLMFIHNDKTRFGNMALAMNDIMIYLTVITIISFGIGYRRGSWRDVTVFEFILVVCYFSVASPVLEIFLINAGVDYADPNTEVDVNLAEKCIEVFSYGLVGAFLFNVIMRSIGRRSIQKDEKTTNQEPVS